MARIHSFWKDPEFYFSVAILAFIAYVLASCPSLSSKGRLIPLIVATGSFPLILLNVLACVFPSLRAAVRGLSAVELLAPAQEDLDKTEQSRKEKPPFFLAGYLAMVFFFSLFFLKYRIRFTWTRAGFMAGLFSLCTWAVFTLVLGLEPFGVRYYY